MQATNAAPLLLPKLTVTTNHGPPMAA
jgi:hypothetical protein